jgi:hypothetical protein
MHKLVSTSVVNRFDNLIELNSSFPQPSLSGVDVLAELRCAEALVTDPEFGFVYAIALKAGIVSLKAEQCRISAGKRRDDLMAERSRPEKLELVTTRETKLNGAVVMGSGGASIGMAPFTSGKASINGLKNWGRRAQRSYTGDVDVRSVTVLPGNRWQIQPDMSRYLDRTYLADSPICQIEFEGPAPTLELSFSCYPRDLALTSVRKGARLHLLRFFTYNKARIATVLVAKGLASFTQSHARPDSASAIEFSWLKAELAGEKRHAGSSSEMQTPAFDKETRERISRVLNGHATQLSNLLVLAGLNPKIDLTHCDLSGVDFGSIDLRGADLTGSDLRNADLSRAKVAGAIFADANLEGAHWPSDRSSGRRNHFTLPKGAPDPRLLHFDDYVLTTKRFPRLAPEQEYMLAKRLQEHADRECGAMLFTSHMRDVIRLSKPWWLEGLSVPHLIEAGNSGLYEAIRTFEPDKGNRLSTAASPYIRRAIADHILQHLTLAAPSADAAKHLRRRLMITRRRCNSEIGSSIEQGRL